MQALEDDLPVNELAEEDFDDGMRQNAIDFAANDKDNDEKLDFMEFAALVREREMGEHTREELRARFKEMDSNGNGYIDYSYDADRKHNNNRPHKE